MWRATSRGAPWPRARHGRRTWLPRSHQGAPRGAAVARHRARGWPGHNARPAGWRGGAQHTPMDDHQRGGWRRVKPANPLHVRAGEAFEPAIGLRPALGAAMDAKARVRGARPLPTRSPAGQGLRVGPAGQRCGARSRLAADGAQAKRNAAWPLVPPLSGGFPPLRRPCPHHPIYLPSVDAAVARAFGINLCHPERTRRTAPASPGRGACRHECFSRQRPSARGGWGPLLPPPTGTAHLWVPAEGWTPEDWRCPRCWCTTSLIPPQGCTRGLPEAPLGPPAAKGGGPIRF